MAVNCTKLKQRREHRVSSRANCIWMCGIIQFTRRGWYPHHFHALNMKNQFKNKNAMGRIVIKSPDTDVLVLLVYYFSRMSITSELWFQTGTITALRGGRRYIPVNHLCKSLSAVLCRILSAAHTLIGCDTTSAMFGIGTKSV